MAKFKKYYLLHLKFLGYRYHGWQKQEKLKTIQGMVDKTIAFITQSNDFKTLGCGRTDARVSAHHFICELFINNELDMILFVEEMNRNLPLDIQLLKMEETDSGFNIIQTTKLKEYRYYFCSGAKPSPTAAPFMAYLGKDLDLKIMEWGAVQYKGLHNFRRFTADSKLNKDFNREIISCGLVPTSEIDQYRCPEDSYMFHVGSKGFLRYQVRLMMGALELLGKHEISKEVFLDYLNEPLGDPVNNIVPGSGLCLHKVLL